MDEKKKGEPDYLHPEGEPKRKPVSGEEKANEEKAKESTQLVEDLKTEQTDSNNASAYE